MLILRSSIFITQIVRSIIMAKCSSTESYVHENFLITRSHKQNTFCLLITIQSLVFQSEQYPPVAPTQVLKGLKCKIQIMSGKVVILVKYFLFSAIQF